MSIVNPNLSNEDKIEVFYLWRSFMLDLISLTFHICILVALVGLD